MTWFKIISMEEFEDCYGGITKKGDVLETTEQEDFRACREYVKMQYGPWGHDIKVRIKEVVE